MAHDEHCLEDMDVDVIELLVDFLELLFFEILPDKGLDDRYSHQYFPGILVYPVDYLLYEFEVGNHLDHDDCQKQDYCNEIHQYNP